MSDSERIVQSRVLTYFRGNLAYREIGNLKEQENRNIREADLLHFLTVKKSYDKKLARKAITLLKREAGCAKGKLYQANKDFYQRLKYGLPLAENADSKPVTVELVDYENPRNNDFAIAEEVTIKGELEKRPDLVIYLNGIAVAVIEMKKSSVSVAEGIRQNLTNQRAQFIESFFTTVQLCLAANESQGLRYGTTLTEEKHYLTWKSDGYHEQENERDVVDKDIEKANAQLRGQFAPVLYRELAHIFTKERFLDLLENFLVFDKGRKKICRYNQYYGVKRAQVRVTSRQNGIIWHTQGSGKTLTMIWLAKWIKAHNHNARVLIVTDREELDEQIERTFGGVDEKIVRTRSGADLISLLMQEEKRLICSLIHKFGQRGGEATGSDYEKYIEELEKNLPQDFAPRGEFFVFVDECHRTQSGKLHLAMKHILPKAVLIGFTGTPLLKKDKKTSLEVFGSFIHTYKFNEAVEDGVVLDLRYEARDIPQDIMKPERIDKWFAHKTRGLTPKAKAILKARWGTLQKVYGSASRLDRIALDIIFTFETTPRLEEGGNALLVADSINSACKYYELFLQHGFKKCAVISSYTPNTAELRTDTVSPDEDTDTWLKNRTYLKMVGLDPDKMPARKSAVGKIIADFEQEAKRKFQEEPHNMRLLIVVDKLLTGFDAPPCTYLFIDKQMRDHGLFQAICRVNRLDGEEKEFGYIVDYKHLFGEIKDALEVYTADNPFSGYEPGDVDGLLKNKGKEAMAKLRERLDHLTELTEGVEPPKDELAYQQYFCGSEEDNADEMVQEVYARIRESLYMAVRALLRAFAEAKPYLVDECSGEEAAEFEKRVHFYAELKKRIALASGDYPDLKAYEPDMRRLIDDYIHADDAEKLGSMEDFTLLEYITTAGDTLTDKSMDSRKRRGAAEGIEGNIRRKIVEKRTLNPKYYENMSVILQRIIAERKQAALDYEELLKRYQELAAKVEKPETAVRYPANIGKSSARRAFFDYFAGDEQKAVALDEAIKNCQGIAGFREDEIKKRRLKRVIYQILRDYEATENIYRLVAEQTEEYL